MACRTVSVDDVTLGVSQPAPLKLHGICSRSSLYSAYLAKLRHIVYYSKLNAYITCVVTGSLYCNSGCSCFLVVAVDQYVILILNKSNSVIYNLRNRTYVTACVFVPGLFQLNLRILKVYRSNRECSSKCS